VKNLTTSQACEGLILYKTATGKSHHTIRNYRNSYKKLLLYFADDPPFALITRDQLVAFFAWLQEEYVSEPDGVAPRGRISLSPKTILNIHTDLSALWTWAVNEGIVEENIVRTIDPPPVEPPVIKTFTKEEIAALLKACDQSRTWKTRQTTANTRPTADRDHAIILVLLDTGIRAQELCDIEIDDLNLGANSIKIGGKGRGRDKKERYVCIGKRTVRALWKYLTPRLKSTNGEDRLFVVCPEDDFRPMSRDILGRLLRRIGNRAGISKVHPHRFRHTFAINYLRNGGDVFTLQALLGHSSLDMVKRYTRMAQIDCANAHKSASPVDNWRL